MIKVGTEASGSRVIPERLSARRHEHRPNQRQNVGANFFERKANTFGKWETSRVCESSQPSSVNNPGCGPTDCEGAVEAGRGRNSPWICFDDYLELTLSLDSLNSYPWLLQSTIWCLENKKHVCWLRAAGTRLKFRVKVSSPRSCLQ